MPAAGIAMPASPARQRGIISSSSSLVPEMCGAVEEANCATKVDSRGQGAELRNSKKDTPFCADASEQPAVKRSRFSKLKPPPVVTVFHNQNSTNARGKGARGDDTSPTYS